MKSIYAKLCLVLLSASLVCALILAPALASTPSNDDSSNNGTETTAETSSEATATEPSSTSAIPTADDGTSLTNDGPYSITLETSAKVMKKLLRSATSSSSVTLNEGNHEKWIDRINVDDTAKNFYAMLEEATDNDGTNDYLIDDKYFDGTAVDDANYSKERTAGNYYVFTNTGGETIYMVIYDAISYSDDNDYETQETKAHDSMAAVYAAFDRDHPEVFWLGSTFSRGSLKASSTNGGTLYPYFVLKSSNGNARANGYTSATAIKSAIDLNNTNVSNIMNTSEVSGASTNHDKVVAFNNWLTTHNAYNSSVAAGESEFTVTDHPDVWECTSALAGKTGTEGPVCEGYARAFKVLCDNVNIPCVLVDGQAKNSASSTGEAHMWNYVQMGSKWYGVDVTWNDPGSYTDANSGSENTNYLLVGADTTIESLSMTFLTSHPVTNCLFTGSVQFTNGPELSTTSYAEDAEAAETVILGNCELNQASSLSATYGDFLNSIQLNGLTMKASDGTEVAGTFAWKNPGQQLKELGSISCPAIFTLAGDEQKTKKVDIQLSVSQKTLTVNAGTINDKTYDGNTTATFLTNPTINGAIEGDDVSLTYSATFGNADVGDNKIVTITYGLEGAAASNYVLSKTDDTAVASIKDPEPVVIPVAGLSLNKSEATISGKGTVQLTATVLPDDATDKSVSWTSSNPQVATVDENGLVTSVGKGTATITVTSVSSPDISDSCTVTVSNPVTSITLNPITLDLVKGQTNAIKAVLQGAFAGSVDDDSVSWSSSDTKVVTVDDSGTVTALSSGQATITASVGNLHATCTVTVTNPAKSVTLSDSSKQATVGDAAFKLTATVNPADADGSVSWQSSNPEVATVSSDGTVEIVSTGQTTITAKIGDVTATCSLTVNAKSIAVTAADNSSYSANVEVTDATSAEKLETILSDKGDVRLVVQALEKISDAVRNVINKLEASGTTVTETLDVFLQGDQDKVAIKAGDGVSMTVCLKMTDAMKKLNPDTIKVYYVADDGTLEDMNAEVNGGYVVFTTTHFSTYIVTGEEQSTSSGDDQPVEEPSNDPTGKQPSEEPSNDPTGDQPGEEPGEQPDEQPGTDPSGEQPGGDPTGDDQPVETPSNNPTDEQGGTSTGDSTQPVATQIMYRLYNPNSGEHFYTANAGERDMLKGLGWNDEGIGWIAPTTGDPVYRLYNPNAGEHHYTTSVAEKAMLVNAGWSYEGIGWYSGGDVRLYREYNPNAYANNHNYTTNKVEHDWLLSLGWNDEGYAWNAVSAR